MRRVVLGCLLAVFLLLEYSPVFCEGEGLLSGLGFGVDGDVSIYTRYIWRGFLMDRDSVVQPSVYISTPDTKFGKLKAGVWSNQPLQNRDNLHSEEFDYIVDYTYDHFKWLSLSFGHTYYDFVENNAFSREFYFGVDFPEFFLTPSLYFYRDYGNQNSGGGLGDYLLLSASYSMPIKNTPLSLGISAHVGLNHNLFMDGDGGDAGIQLGFTMPLTKNLSFTPNANYSLAFGDLADEAHGNQKNQIFCGGTFAYKL